MSQTQPQYLRSSLKNIILNIQFLQNQIDSSRLRDYLFQQGQEYADIEHRVMDRVNKFEELQKMRGDYFVKYGEKKKRKKRRLNIQINVINKGDAYVGEFVSRSFREAAIMLGEFRETMKQN